MSEWQKSDSIAELATALAKAQALIKGAAKDSVNPHFRSSYADLSSVWDACREPLTANGLSIVQLPDNSPEGAGVTTILMHSSGQWISGRVSAPLEKQNPQGVGSALTYLRRYALAAMAGVAPEDDDAEAATSRDARTKAKAPTLVPRESEQDRVERWFSIIRSATTKAQLVQACGDINTEIRSLGLDEDGIAKVHVPLGQVRREMEIKLGIVTAVSK